MKPVAARALTSLYAPAWKRTYGAEFEALLADLPLTPALLADVIPRAIASRASLVAAVCFALLALAVSGSHVASSRAPQNVAVRERPHTGESLLACRSYSSTAKSEFIARRQCLD